MSTLFALIFPKLSTAPGTQEGLQTWFLNEGSNKKQVELKLGSGSPDPAHSSTHQHTVSLPRHVVNQTLLSKVDNPLVGAPGTKSVPGDCSEHQNYVENVLLFKHNIQFSLQSPRALLIWRGVGWGLKCNEWLIFSKWHISFMMHDCNRGCLKPAVPSSAKKKKKKRRKKKKKWLFSGVNTLKGQEIHIHFLASRLDSIFRRQVEQKSLNIMLIQETLGSI